MRINQLIVLIAVAIVGWCEGYDIVKARLGVEYNDTTSPNASLRLLYDIDNSKLSKNESLKLYAHSDASELIISVQYLHQTWMTNVPTKGEKGVTYNVSHTLCIPFDRSTNDNFTVSVIISGANLKDDKNSGFTFRLDAITTMLPTDTYVNALVSFGSPLVYHYSFGNEQVQSVIVNVDSPTSSSCGVLSIQSNICPINDHADELLNPNGDNFKYYQTFTTKAAMIINKDAFKDEGFFIIIMLLSDPSICLNSVPSSDPHSPIGFIYTETDMIGKQISISIDHGITNDMFLAAVFTLIAILLVIVLLAIVCVFHIGRKSYNKLREEAVSIQHQFLTSGANAANNNYGAIGDPDADFDQITDITGDADFAQLRREGVNVTVADMTLKKFQRNDRKFDMYYSSLIVLSIFYALPAVQLFYLYMTSKATANNENCYYNFLCSHPVGVLTAFNSVYSNISYVTLGLLFLVIVRIRSAYFKDWECLVKPQLSAEDGRRISSDISVVSGPSMNTNTYPNALIATQRLGLPNHYGIFYALGWALVMEGIMSACYHVCPNSQNFQFDTAFMYIIACLLLTKIYQTRHPDITKQAQSFYYVIAVLIILGFIGAMNTGRIVYTVMAVLIVTMSLYLSLHFYYMGRLKLRWNIFDRCYRNVRLAVARRYFKPDHCCRLLWLVLFNALTWFVAIFGALHTPLVFDTYLLGFLILILMCYTLFYIGQKLRHKEAIPLIAWLLIGLSCVVWGGALFCFMQRQYSWTLTPAESRALNIDCIVMGFYDYHDVWHCLSALAMFLSFCTLLCIDDRIATLPRQHIKVF